MATSHPKLSSLWETLLVFPADVSARLAYADALEEFGDGKGELDRANFIRSHIELATYGKRRKVYEWVDSFNFRDGNGYCFVEGRDEPMEGDRVDLVLPEEERSRDMPNGKDRKGNQLYLKRTPFKKLWEGVLVTRKLWSSRREHNRYELEFRVDGSSRPWPGAECLRRCSDLFRLYDGRGDIPLPYWGAGSDTQNGTHRTDEDRFSVEIWPDTPGSNPEPKHPRWRFVWNNGFPDHVVCQWSEWRDHGPYAVNTVPINSMLCIHGPVNWWTPVDWLPWARHSAGLDRWDEKAKVLVPNIGRRELK